MLMFAMVLNHAIVHTGRRGAKCYMVRQPAVEMPSQFENVRRSALR